MSCPAQAESLCNGKRLHFVHAVQAGAATLTVGDPGFLICIRAQPVGELSCKSIGHSGRVAEYDGIYRIEDS